MCVYLASGLAYPQDDQPQYGVGAQLVTKTETVISKPTPRPPNYKNAKPSNRRKKPKRPIGIRRYAYNAPVESDGAFSYSYETENDIKQEVIGTMKTIKVTNERSNEVEEKEVLVMRGSYEYIGPDGVTYVVNWVADENGYRPSGRHLPKPVPIPFPDQAKAVAEQIRRAKEEQMGEH